MPWFRLDDSFDTHPKVIAAGNEAIGLYIRCGTYAARHLTNGLVDQDVVALYSSGNASLAERLIKVRLWHRRRTGIAIHDYLDYNPSREQVLAKRKVRAEAGRKGGVASGKARSKDEANCFEDASGLVEPPSRPVSSVVDVVDRVNGSSGYAPDLIDLTITEIKARTGRNITAGWAQQVCDHILQGRSTASPRAYVRSAIRNEPDPRGRFLPAYPEKP